MVILRDALVLTNPRGTGPWRRAASIVAACSLLGFVLGLLLVWAIHVEVRAQLRDQAPWSVTPASSYTPSAPVLASPEGPVFNFVRPEWANDFEALTARLQQVVDGWNVVRAAERAPDGSMVYVFTIDHPQRGDNYDLLLALSRAFPSEGIPLYIRYNRACAAPQRVVSLTAVMAQTP